VSEPGRQLANAPGFVARHGLTAPTVLFDESMQVWEHYRIPGQPGAILLDTTGKPVAGKGARRSLLGTIRRGSRLQVTYRGRPPYYSAHEGAGEVRCHNVNLHGGLWWVIGANGERRR
jgi:hypothetical protein